MPSPARLRRQARERVISIALAVFIGLVIGGGGWVLWNRQGQITETENKKITQVDLVAHKALYGVSMISARNGSQIINIDGKMFYQMRKECDGYMTDHRFVLTYDYADTEPLRVTSDFSTVESLEGNTFDYSSRRRRDGELYQELRGSAVITQQQGGLATFSKPEGLKFSLDPNVLFPSAHTRLLVQTARSGKKFLSMRVFDGSDEEGPVDVTAVIGARVDILETLAPGTALDRRVLKVPAWKVHLAFFPLQKGEETADYALNMVLHDNGVISDMVIDYPDFSVHQQLLALESLSVPPCHGREGAIPSYGDSSKMSPPSSESDLQKNVPDAGHPRPFH